MVNTRAGGAPADAEGITRAEDEEEGLNDADRSTLYNLFKEDHRGWTLPPAVVERLVNLFVKARDTGPLDRWTTTAERDCSGMWEEALLEAFPACPKTTKREFFEWLRARGNLPAVASTPPVVTTEMVEISAGVEEAERGAEGEELGELAKDPQLETGTAVDIPRDPGAQCVCAPTAWIIFFGRVCTAHERRWWLSFYNAPHLGGRTVGVPLNTLKSYTQLSKSSKYVRFLERCLDERSEFEFDAWARSTSHTLGQVGLCWAASRLIDVTNQAREAFPHWALRRQYYQRYFFKHHHGLGLPEELCTKSSIETFSTSKAPSHFDADYELPFAGGGGAGGHSSVALTQAIAEAVAGALQRGFPVSTNAKYLGNKSSKQGFKKDAGGEAGGA